MLTVIVLGTIFSLVFVFLCGLGIILYKKQNCLNALKTIRSLIVQKMGLVSSIVSAFQATNLQEQRSVAQVLQTHIELEQALVELEAKGRQSIFHTYSFIHTHIVFKNRINLLLADIDRHVSFRKNEHILYAKSELIDLDNQISLTRYNFNDAVGKYNTQLMMFPSNIIAKFLQFKRVPNLINK